MTKTHNLAWLALEAIQKNISTEPISDNIPITSLAPPWSGPPSVPTALATT